MHKRSTSRTSNNPEFRVLKPNNGNVASSSSRVSSIPKYKPTESAQKSKNERKGSSGEKMSRISLASSKMTPSKFTTPKLNNVFSIPQVSRVSTDTVRSSFGGKTGSKVWPTNEISFKTKCIDKIIEFFSVKNFDYPLHRAMLRAPTKRDFAVIFSFVYRQFDPNYNLPDRFEDEIPKILKRMNYPVQMPKSSFLNVGSPHTWPSVLAMLAWLIDTVTLFDVSNPADIAFSKDFDDEVELSEKKFMSLIAAALCESQQEKEIILMEYKKDVMKGQNLTPEVLEDLQLESQSLRSRLARSACVKDKLSACKRQHLQLCDDKEKLVKFNNDLKSHISVKSRDRSQIESQLTKLKEDLEQGKDEIKSLEELKKTQNYSISELKRFKNHGEEVANQMNHLQIEKQKLNEQIWALELETTKSRKALSESILAFNSAGSQVATDFPELSTADLERGMLEREMEILSAIKTEKKKVKEEQHEVHNSLVSLKKDFEKRKEDVGGKESMCHKLKCKVKRLDEEVLCLKEDITHEETELQKECERLAGLVSQARRRPKINLYEKQRQLDEAKKEFEALKAKDREMRGKGDKMVLESRRMLHECLEARAQIIKEHENRREDILTKHLIECKEIIETLKEN